MTEYNLLFLDGDRVRHIHHIQAADDMAAMDEARTVDLGERAAELWHGRRLLLSLPAPAFTAEGSPAK